MTSTYPLVHNRAIALDRSSDGYHLLRRGDILQSRMHVRAVESEHDRPRPSQLRVDAPNRIVLHTFAVNKCRARAHSLRTLTGLSAGFAELLINPLSPWVIMFFRRLLRSPIPGLQSDDAPFPDPLAPGAAGLRRSCFPYSRDSRGTQEAAAW